MTSARGLILQLRERLRGRNMRVRGADFVEPGCLTGGLEVVAGIAAEEVELFDLRKVVPHLLQPHRATRVAVAREKVDHCSERAERPFSVLRPSGPSRLANVRAEQRRAGFAVLHEGGGGCGCDEERGWARAD